MRSPSRPAETGGKNSGETEACNPERTEMRRSFYNIRSICLGSLALIASVLLASQMPASAEIIPLDAGYHAIAHQPMDFAIIAFDVLPAAELARLDVEFGSVMASTGFEPLKPEYAESYATNGLNFIDLRRRC
jgi:hypothetical protein